jgi:hypothetical protein
VDEQGFALSGGDSNSRGLPAVERSGPSDNLETPRFENTLRARQVLSATQLGLASFKAVGVTFEERDALANVVETLRSIATSEVHGDTGYTDPWDAVDVIEDTAKAALARLDGAA